MVDRSGTEPVKVRRRSCGEKRVDALMVDGQKSGQNVAKKGQEKKKEIKKKTRERERERDKQSE